MDLRLSHCRSTDFEEQSLLDLKIVTGTSFEVFQWSLRNSKIFQIPAIFRPNVIGPVTLMFPKLLLIIFIYNFWNLEIIATHKQVMLISERYEFQTNNLDSWWDFFFSPRKYPS